MPSSAFDNANNHDTEKSSQTQFVKEVHFSVFFDGTSNNMVQQAYFKSFKEAKIKELTKVQIEKTGDVNEIINAKDEIYNCIYALYSLASLKYNENQNLSAQDIPTNYYTYYCTRLNNAINIIQKNIPETYKNEINEIKDKIEIIKSYKEKNDSSTTRINIILDSIVSKSESLINENLDRLQIESKFTTTALYADNENGYSNIAILHSLTNEQKNNNENIYKTLYIEGSGANDISTTKGNTLYLFEKNTNGLGFGLGKTGVTALVSKAIDYIYNFLNSKSIKSKLNNDIKYHFYVFGFSRGATCARLFTELATRKENQKLNREAEFGQETSKVKDIYDSNGKRIPFMETNFIEDIEIKRENVSVDFLGIYDTVASIGFLKQKDGWTNSLSLIYRSFWWNNYHGNFHYMNARDYGLYSPNNEKVKFTLHICAGDEFRENFALVNIGKKIPANAMEIIIPGCHSDIGGGYVTGNGMDAVIYKFIPRKFERLMKSYLVRITPLRLVSDIYLRNKEKATMFIKDPYIDDKANTKELSPETLAQLGWIEKEWENGNYNTLKTQENEKVHYTLRVANGPNEIKFKRYTLGGYGNIPLQMMVGCFKKCIQKSTNGRESIKLFKEKTTPYDIPTDLEEFGKNLITTASVCPHGERLWLMPKGGYSGEFYQKLRLKYLHFTSSCEILHFRVPINNDFATPTKRNDNTINDNKENIFNCIDTEFANFGNNCNYDNNARICRIMYNGDDNYESNMESTEKAKKENKYVHYIYELGNGYGLNCREIEYDKIIEKKEKMINNSK